MTKVIDRTESASDPSIYGSYKADDFQKAKLSTIPIAIGIIASLVSIFILLASFKVLPHRINTISSLGLLGRYIGYGTAGLGVIFISSGAVLRICSNKATRSNVDTGVPKSNEISSSEEVARAETIPKIEQDPDSSLYLSTTTPENFEERIDVNSEDISLAKKGAFTFSKAKKIFSGYLCLQPKVEGSNECEYMTGLSLKIKEGKFIHDENGTWDTKRSFSNLKEFFDYLFKGEFYQGELIRPVEFFIVKTPEGKEIKYNNPYYKKSRI